MRYCVLYPNCRNVNLVKEMGMMPYKLHELYGFDSYLACYKQGEYDYIHDEVKGLKLHFIEKKYNNYSLDGIAYLKKEAKNIDILQIFHVTLYSVFYAFTYKKINPNGKIYLKLDCSHKLINKIQSLDFARKKFLDMYLDKVDIISVEQKKLFEQLKELLPKHSIKMINIPNGVDFDLLYKENIVYDFDKKENIILNVARIGAEEKNTKMLLEAFSKIKNIEKMNWKLVLIGGIEKGFNEYINDFFSKNPMLKDKVTFKGEIKDRKVIFEEYNRAKIFCLTSDFESFAFALIEAAALGDIIVSTDVGIARELVCENNGALVGKNDSYDLSRKLQEFIKDDNLKSKSKSTHDLCKKNFSWNEIIKKLHNELKSRFDKGI